MALKYKFKKEKVEGGKTVLRPKILIRLHGEKQSLELPALIDTGCDITVIPEDVAKLIGLKMEGEKTRFFGFQESNEAVFTQTVITFLSRAHRFDVKVNVPILIAKAKPGQEELLPEVTLGIARIFDVFNIHFQKSKNQILFNKVE